VKELLQAGVPVVAGNANHTACAALPHEHAPNSFLLVMFHSMLNMQTSSRSCVASTTRPYILNAWCFAMQASLRATPQMTPWTLHCNSS